MTKTISILGSTGSIGKSTLDILRQAPKDHFKIIALTANRNAALLAQQALEFDAEFVALASEEQAESLKAELGGRIEFGIGADALVEAARRNSDFVLSSIIGAAGLQPTLAAVERGAQIGLANKESLVCAGPLFMQAVAASGATLLPIDSEHNAIFQVLDDKRPQDINRLILTASGGPFREYSLAEMESIELKDALKHPVWDMGAKITVDSATMMNKGLELIEASFLFDMPGSKIDIMVHPQSIVHSMVEYVDGSVLSQMGTPDMKTPIAYALAWPNRMEAYVKPLDLINGPELSFFAPDPTRFPALKIARDALESGGHAPNVLNAANEVAVEAFLDKQITFLQIASVSRDVLHTLTSQFNRTLDLTNVLAMDELARQTATDLIKRLRSR